MLSRCINILLLYYQGWMIVNINRQSTENLRGFFFHTLLPGCTLMWCAHGLNESFQPALQSIWITPWLICSGQSVAGRKIKGMRHWLWHSPTVYWIDITSVWRINFVLECCTTQPTLTLCVWYVSVAVNNVSSQALDKFLFTYSSKRYKWSHFFRPLTVTWSELLRSYSSKNVSPSWDGCASHPFTQQIFTKVFYVSGTYISSCEHGSK